MHHFPGNLNLRASSSSRKNIINNSQPPPMLLDLVYLHGGKSKKKQKTGLLTLEFLIWEFKKMTPTGPTGELSLDHVV